ncbi:nucleolar complex protein 3 [Planococcus citri]|uniref:nucleolar complex protein 3 n=1 Tax=Planococcus citri TaxID=170843 RepID=UPI0031F9CBFB
MTKKKATKKVKSKTSGVKQRNRLRNKGKLKTKKHVSKSAFMALQNKQTLPVTQPQEHTPEDVADMLDKDYEWTKPSYMREYNTKMLLPIKTKQGLERRFTDVTDEPEDEEEEPIEKEEKRPASGLEDDEITWSNELVGNEELDLDEPVSVAKIYAKREQLVNKYKFRIGLLSSTLLENPEMKIENLDSLLEIMSSKDPEVQLTVKKLVTLSLLEIFKDLIPAYQIKHQDVPLKKLKKITQQLVGYEGQLLKGYQAFLVNLEAIAQCLRKKKGDNRVVTPPEKKLGILAVKCLSELLETHPYFNYADNIVHLLTMYLDNPDEEVRKIVEECYKRVFHQDKRGLISLSIVRRINYLVKTRAHCVHCEALAVLLALRIKNVNLDDEKEEEIKNKQLQNKRQRVLSLSKKERKRKKELAKLDKEMLEAEAEENKKSKQQHMTEIVKMVFLIYFRILKRAPRSNLLSITLEGVAKFAHCINLEYYQDLVNVLDQLLTKGNLNIREQLYCIKTVFIILSGQENMINIDPLYFYSHLYRVMLEIHAGKTYESIETLLSTLEAVLVHKRKQITTQRMLSFTKRLATLALQVLHNGSLGALSIVKSVVQLTKAADLLLDVECNYGQGVYNPELNEPEYCNAGNTAMWELCALRRHYHPTTRKLSIHVCNGAPTLGEGSLPAELSKLTSTNFCDQYDPTNVAFKPSIPAPNKKPKQTRNVILKNDFIKECDTFLNNTENNVDFSTIFK